MKTNLNSFLTIGQQLPIGSRLQYMHGGAGSNLNILVLLIAGIIALVILAAVALVWGILILLGVILIMTGALVVILGKGSRPDAIFVIAIIVGIVFIALSLYGVELGTVDLGAIPGLQGVHDYFNPCLTCP